MNKPSRLRNALNFLSFQVGWFSCALGAAWGAPWTGPVVVTLLIAAHLVYASERAREALLIALVGVGGTIVDSGLAAAAVFSFHHDPIAPVCAPFMVALWFNFATAANYSLGWLKRRYWLAALFGALGGPSTYYAGARLGALAMNDDLFYSLAVITVEWTLVAPAIFWLAARLEIPPQPTKARLATPPEAA